MSTRKEIKDGSRFDLLKVGVVYTEVSGWVDMGHARGDDIATLKRQFVDGERSGKGDLSAGHENCPFWNFIRCWQVRTMGYKTWQK